MAEDRQAEQPRPHIMLTQGTVTVSHLLCSVLFLIALLTFSLIALFSRSLLNFNLHQFFLLMLKLSIKKICVPKKRQMLKETLELNPLLSYFSAYHPEHTKLLFTMPGTNDKYHRSRNNSPDAKDISLLCTFCP